MRDQPNIPPPPPPPPPRPALSPLAKLAVDLGPLVIFFIAYSRLGMIMATGAFMVATLIAIIVSFVFTRHVPPMMWFSAVLVGIFGGLTVWLRDETFIKMKPTIVYLCFAAVLGFGLLRRRNYLKSLLGTAFTGLSDEGWRLLAIRWTGFFLVLAVLNEIIWRMVSTDAWVMFKVWGVTPLTFLFAMAQFPLLKRHGLDFDQK